MFINSPTNQTFPEGADMAREVGPVGVEYTNGTRYLGDIKDGKRHGRGELFDKEGSPIYKGGWANGEREGHGRHYNRGKLEYSGEWQGGKPHGYGTQYSINGCKSEYEERGWWVKGSKEGLFQQYRDGTFCRWRLWSRNNFRGHWVDWAKPGTPVGPGEMPWLDNQNIEFMRSKDFGLKVTFDGITGRCMQSEGWFHVDFDSPHPEFGSEFTTKSNQTSHDHAIAFIHGEDLEKKPLVWWIEWDGVLHSDGREFQILHGHGESEEWVEGTLPTVEEMRENTGIVWKEWKAGDSNRLSHGDFDSPDTRIWIVSLRPRPEAWAWECPACSDIVPAAEKRCQCGWRRSGDSP